MKKNIFEKNLKISFLIIVFSFVFIFFNFILKINSVKADTGEINELNQKIQEKKDYIDKLEKEKAKYEKEIEDKQKDILSLNNEISILESNINKTKIKINLLKIQVEQKNEEIEEVKLEIEKKEKEIASQKEKLGEVIRMIYKNSRKNYLELILISDSLSDFFNQWQYEEKLQEVLQKDVNKLKLVRQSLETQKSDLENKKKNLLVLQENLNEERENYEEKENFKLTLLNETRGKERNFQSLLADLRAEYNQMNAEISSLEKEVRKKLSQQKMEELGMGGDLSLFWPAPSKIITCRFHDPYYPMRRWIGEHSGIDIRASQGTAVEAAASGYVARAKDAGMGYSYIMIIHNDEMSTLYGHLIKISVQEDTYVTKGQIIGLSGGLPGTRGAGSFSLGPHLHFEVRINGIPVNPEDYLSPADEIL
ncbi:MAG: Peptidase M23B [Parcubacteria group bacterium Athens1014_10]|nr:MAG: Peptidase M23B [Parcubacteria group bacterium Athens1014_10]TSD06032.1 MAG: Peptidase M23B [Parcubacteria group bacterium Athens0714_12]